MKLVFLCSFGKWIIFVFCVNYFQANGNNRESIVPKNQKSVFRLPFLRKKTVK
ncbi:hypothetical protein JF634_10350 [Simonsiella muelleri]|uniref:hypothetical protein n=1 Tax=Simonsiella muelleri TaxID=72 RepID=UPI0012DC9859|nr:hypothetical protein [Simonsiella muelleri]UBQ53555.1 hypothetical protein JF634_10350 [Simonsiella muelleri]